MPLTVLEGACAAAIDMNALRAKGKQKDAEDKSAFIPIALNEVNAQAAFDRCLAADSGAYDMGCPFAASHGISSPHFSAEKIQKNRNYFISFRTAFAVHVGSFEDTKLNVFLCAV